MSGDDYISKLFTDNEHKLDEMPSNDLWSRIEAKLDTQPVVHESETKEIKLLQQTSKSRRTSFLRFAPYAAAASVLLLVVATFTVINWSNPKSTLAEEQLPELVDVELAMKESEEKGNATPILDSDKDSAFKANDDVQRMKLLADAKVVAKKEHKKADVVEKYGLEALEINDASKDVIVLTTETAVEEDKAVIAPPRTANSDVFSNNNMANAPVVQRSEYFNNGRAYANPPSADPNLADEIDSYAQRNMSADKKAETKAASKIKNRKNKTVAEQELDSHLQIFEWMLGSWSDSEEEGGKSFENWRRVNSTTLEGVGTKMNGNNKIFEEKLTIYYDAQIRQVFLKMSLDDTRAPMLYMLTSFDTERIVFEQRENTEAPNKVIYQRDLNGFTTIIVHDGNFLKPSQQSYLEHRNRVSNVRAIRILKSMD